MTTYLEAWPKTLRPDSTACAAVKWVQTRLQDQGFFAGAIGGNYGPITTAAVKYFQSTHLGPDGAFLPATGICDYRTIWALENPVGDAQRSFIDPVIPRGLSGSRLKFLSTIAADHRSGEFVEVPDGSNSGPRLKAFSKGEAWCCYYQSDAWKRTFGEYPMGADQGHCKTFWNRAKKAGLAIPKAEMPPLPGDLGIILYPGSDAGHIFAVGCVAAGGTAFNTFGGNEGNRLKHGRRAWEDKTIVGWIDLHGSRADRAKVTFQTGLASASAAAGGYAATR